MARDEQEREDLLREATALVERAELQLAGFADAWVVGFRRDGSLSVYCGSDPVWQFNALGELRRGFLDGRLLKAQRGRLVSLERTRPGGQVALVRHDLSPAESAAVLEHCESLLSTAQAALESRSYAVSGQVPADADVLGRWHEWLRVRPRPLSIAAAPHVAGQPGHATRTRR